jgi:hypothetical protein
VRTSLKNKQRNRYPDLIEHWIATQDIIRTSTCGLVEGGLRIDRGKLSDQERTEIISLTLGGAEGGGFNTGRLGARDADRWQQLVEKGAGKEPGSVFDAARDWSKLVSGLAKIEQDLRRPPRRVDLHEQGSVTLSREIAFDWFDRPDPVLYIRQLGLLCWFCGQFENGKCIARNGGTEGEGDDLVLVLDLSVGLGGQLDDEDTLIRWQRDLEHLAANNFFAVERSGQTLRVSRGSRLRATKRAVA